MPRRFGKYTLLRTLARGGMAELFLAIQRSVAGFEKLIVIKRILPSMNDDHAFIEMLLHEARIAATLSHPNIVQIFDLGQAEGRYYIAMEHVHGEDIRSIVRQMKKTGVPEFPLEHALAIVLGMCTGLVYAHEKRDLDGTPLGIVHRDISPQNVVVTFTGDVKVVDFGIAKSDTKMVSETKSGKLKGKVPYMSPEQARGETIDSRSDIFAAGVMLFELTTGKRLFKGSSEYETLRLICERDYPSPSQVRPGYPLALEAIVHKALAKNRVDRYQSAREMQADLEAFVRDERIAVSTINLTRFMHTLFEAKLESQKEALLQGKHLADIIEQQERESVLDLPSSGAGVPSMPAASHTLPGIDALRRRPGTPMMLVAVGALCLLIVGIAAVWPRTRSIKESANAGATAAAKGSIHVSSDPPGAAIWLDGDLRPELTPATFDQLPANDRSIEIKVTKEGFEVARQTVTLSAGNPIGKVNLALKRGSVVAEVDVLNPGLNASLSLDGQKVDGLKVNGLASGTQHILVVSARGYADYTTSFIGAAEETKHFDVNLQRLASSPRSSAAGVAAANSMGKLNVGASGGWCNVTVDGVARGPTPLAGVELSAGSHRVSCIPGDGRPPQTSSVSVPAEGTARYKFAL